MDVFCKFKKSKKVLVMRILDKHRINITIKKLFGKLVKYSIQKKNSKELIRKQVSKQ
jgi:hypothetical protein